MRFMMIIKATPESEASAMPNSEDIAAMGRFNEELIAAGVMLAGEGLHSSAKGARVKKSGGKTVVTDGPFAEAKELVAGFWIIQAASFEEALAWAKKVPLAEGDEIEVRQVHEISDFVVDEVTEEHLKREQAWRDQYQTRDRQ